MVVMAPADETECWQMLYTGTTLPGPSAVRYPRGIGTGAAVDQSMTALPVGQAQVRRRGDGGIAILAFGSMVQPALEVAERVDATVVNMRFVKPLDEALLRDIATTHSAIVTIEENVVAGGAGSGCAEYLDSVGLDIPRLHIGVPDQFITHGSRNECLAAAGLDIASISARIDRWRISVPQLRGQRAGSRVLQKVNP